MNPTVNAIRLGLHRGLREFVQSVRSPQDQGFYLFTALIVLGYLLIRRNDRVGVRARDGSVVWVLVLGMLAMMPLGMIIGALVPNMQKVGTWGMLPILVLTGISGIFYPIQQLWGWVQVIAQIFPTYWIGLGMRSAFLPDSAAALEVGDSWRTPETALVLTAWAIVGVIVTPIVLRRMARRQSGSQMEAARETAAQWIR